MKLLVVILAAVTVLSTPSFAAKAGKKQGKGAEIRKTLRAYDRNRNRQIDGAEIEALKSGYAALKRIDANSDGSIGDDEIKDLNSKIPAKKASKAKGDSGNNGKKKRKKAR
jgi:hypothetical protein